MADKHETDSESDPTAAQTPEEVEGTPDLPGELLAEDLKDPGAYEIDPSEDEAEELEPPASPDEVSALIEDLDFEIDDQEQLDEAEEVSAAAKSSRPMRKPRRAKRAKPVADDETHADDEDTEPARPATGPGSKRPVRKQPASGKTGRPVKKGTKTGKKKVVRKRTTPPQFVRESVGELKKVVWPTMSQLRQYFIVVLVFVLFVIAFVGLLDLGFGAGLLWLFGRQS